jgi:hypothetical protein
MPLTPLERAIQVVVVANLGGGHNLDKVFPGFESHELIDSLNVNVRDGSLVKRGGYQDISDDHPGKVFYGGAQFNLHGASGSITRQVLAIYGTTLYENVAGTLTSRGTMAGSRPATFAQAGNRMFISNGATDPLVWDGTSLQDAICPVPDQPTYEGTETTPGYLDTTYEYHARVCYYSSTTGDISNPSDLTADDPITVSNDGRKRKYNVPGKAGIPDRFDKIRVFRTRADMATELYEEEYDMPDPTVTTAVWVGSKSDTGLGDLLEFDNDDIPQYQVLVFWDGRLFGLNDPDNPTELGWSKSGGQYTAWPLLDNRLDLDKLDGFGLTGLWELAGRLYAFKRNKCYLISTDPVTAYAPKNIPAPTGLICHWAAARAENALWGIGDGIFWRFDGGGFEDISKGRYSAQMQKYVTASMTDPIDLIHDYDYTRRDLIVGCPTSVHATGGAFINLDAASLTLSDGHRRRLFVGNRADGRPWLMGDKGDGTLIEFFEDDSGVALTDDSGSDIIQSIKTSWLDPEPRILKKTFERIDFLIVKPVDILLDDGWIYSIYMDGNDTTAVETGTIGPYGDHDSSYRIFSRRLKGQHSQCISVGLENSASIRGAYRLVALRIYWRPAGDLVSL